jgi:hypothetical protein
MHPFFPNAPPASSKPKQKKNKGKEINTSATSIIDKIKELETRRDEYQTELRIRGRQTIELCTMCMVLRAVLTRLHTGAFTPADHLDLAPPQVSLLKANGATAGYEYIRQSLTLLRPAIVKLAGEAESARHSLLAIEQAMDTVSLTSSNEDGDSAQVEVGYEVTQQVLEEIDD